MRTVSIALLFAVIFISCDNNPKNGPVTDVVENDTTTSIINRDSASIHSPQPSTQRISCKDAAMNILMSSKRYVQLTKGLQEKVVKNGGDGFGIMLEGSPDTERDTSQTQSTTYDFSIHESYPDRAPVIARFTFDPVTKQLFEYNTAQDSLVPIDFDKKQLIIFEDNCK